MQIQEIPINNITPSPFQPRETFDKITIQQLSNSIKKYGLINPISVRPLENNNYQIISGERRWRAFQFAKIKNIPAIIKNIDDKQYKKESLIENVHREDLSTVERGRAIYTIFQDEGVNVSSKKLANKVQYIEEKKRQNIALDAREKNISKIAQDIEIEPRTIRLWLEAISIDENILKMELSKPKDMKIDGNILARLSTIKEEDLQLQVYRKITQQDMGREKSSKFISQIKKLPKEEREAILTSSIPVEIIGDRSEGYSIEIPEETIEELRQAVKIGEKETAAVLAKPIVQERGRHRRNWQAHLEILTVLNNLFCPYCGKPAMAHLRWLCHDSKSMEDCKDQAGNNFEEASKRKKADPQFLRK